MNERERERKRGIEGEKGRVCKGFFEGVAKELFISHFIHSYNIA